MLIGCLVFPQVKQYFHLVTKFNASCSSAEVEKEIFFLNHKVHEIYMECFVSLVFKYKAVLFRHDWTTLLDTPGIIYGTEEAFDAMGLQLEWLAGLANDISHIDHEFYHGTINEISIVNIECEIKNLIDLGKMTQHFTNVNSFSQEFSRQSAVVAHGSLEFISFIFFQSFANLIPTKDMYKAWSGNAEPKGLVQSMLGEIIWNLNAIFADLEPYCALYLLLLCYRKLHVWYVYFLKECGDSNVSFDENDFNHVHTDCTSIMKEFTVLLDKFDQLPTSSVKETKLKKIIEYAVLNSFSIHVLLSGETGSIELEEVINTMHDDAVREPYKAKGYMGLIETLTTLRKRSCRAERLHTCTSTMHATRQRFSNISDTKRRTKSKNENENIFPFPNCVVYDKQIPLEEYLFGNLSKTK